MYDWNTAQAPQWRGAHRAKLVDETLRDGLQSPSVTDPPLGDKIDLLLHMEHIGVDVVSVGLPAAGPRATDDSAALARYIGDHKLRLVPTAAARTVVGDVERVVEVSQRAGLPVEVYAFVGSSPIRHYAEDWDIDWVRRCIEGSLAVARRAQIPFCLVTEDTTRARPDVLDRLLRPALEGGAARLCLCDTVGHATPDGAARLIRFVRDLLTATGRHDDTGLDWHAHNDRGLALQTALWASEFGVDRVHGCALGIGERVGNAPLELLALNLGLLGARRKVEPGDLVAYCERAARALGIDLPLAHPFAPYWRAAPAGAGRAGEAGRDEERARGF
ncbi:MAG: 2-isopropylmalate synthase [Deltaproteobacteria bacterium]|nr:2-isopropylmalate synthase [Deltaproteobacteria bacterium]